MHDTDQPETMHRTAMNDANNREHQGLWQRVGDYLGLGDSDYWDQLDRQEAEQRVATSGVRVRIFSATGDLICDTLLEDMLS